jgi:hypothetical protein
MTVFEVLADPGRRDILRLLLDGERSVGSLVAELSLAQPNVSKHLKVLRQAGFVEVRPNASASTACRPSRCRNSTPGSAPSERPGPNGSTRSNPTSTPWRIDHGKRPATR